MEDVSPNRDSAIALQCIVAVFK